MGQPARRFRLRLAGFLGKFPHEIDQMPMSDFVEFMLYEQMEPFGDLRTDLNAGIIASTMVNVNLKSGSEPIMPDRFMPNWKWDQKPGPTQSQEAQLAFMLALQAKQNATLKN